MAHGNLPIIAGDKRGRFSEKVALIKDHQYFGDTNQGGKWRLTLQPYLVSRAPDIDQIFNLIEGHDDLSTQFVFDSLFATKLLHS